MHINKLLTRNEPMLKISCLITIFFIYLSDILAHYFILVSIMLTHVNAPLFNISCCVFFYYFLFKTYMTLHRSDSIDAIPIIYMFLSNVILSSLMIFGLVMFIICFTLGISFVQISYLCCGIVCFYYSFLV